MPGGINLANVPIDLRKIEVPAYFLSTREDHIAPWRSTYAGARLISGPVRFVLGASGHVAGVINPPSANKYGYWTSKTLAGRSGDLAERRRRFTRAPGGPIGRSGSPVMEADKFRRVSPGAGELAAIEDAPGSYVKVRAS